MNSEEKFNKIYEEKIRLTDGKRIFNKIKENPVLTINDAYIGGFISKVTIDFVIKLLLEEYKQNLKTDWEKFDKMIGEINI